MGVSIILPLTGIAARPLAIPSCSNRRTMSRASAISSSLGEKTRFTTSTCPGWMQYLPRKPRLRARRRDLARGQYRLRGLHQRDDGHGAALHPLPPLQDRQIVVGAPHRFGAVGLGEDDPVQAPAYHR